MTLRSYVTGRRWLWTLIVLALAGLQLYLGYWQWSGTNSGCPNRPN